MSMSPMSSLGGLQMAVVKKTSNMSTATFLVAATWGIFEAFIHGGQPGELTYFLKCSIKLAPNEKYSH